MAGLKDIASDALAKLDGRPTMADLEARANLNRYLEGKQQYREFQSENLPLELAQFDPYTLPKEYLMDPNVGPTSPYAYDRLRLPTYKHSVNPKNATASGLETLPAKDYNYWLNQPSLEQMEYYKKHPPLMSLTGAYALPRAIASAKELGIPQLSPEVLGGMYLQEGRTDMGSNTHDINNPQSEALVSKLMDQYGMDYKTASFLTTVKEKQDIADRLHIPFARAWNGLGRVKGMDRTGTTYANELDAQIAAAKKPENKNLMDIINLGLAHGQKYPLIDPKAREAYNRENAGIASLVHD